MILFQKRRRIIYNFRALFWKIFTKSCLQNSQICKKMLMIKKWKKNAHEKEEIKTEMFVHYIDYYSNEDNK